MQIGFPITTFLSILGLIEYSLLINTDIKWIKCIRQVFFYWIFTVRVETSCEYSIFQKHLIYLLIHINNLHYHNHRIYYLVSSITNNVPFHHFPISAIDIIHKFFSISILFCLMVYISLSHIYIHIYNI